jgi:hypothetical protein
MSWLWLPLGFLLLVPVIGYTAISPFPMGQTPLLERAIPILWLVLTGAAALIFRVAKASIPLAALIAWAVVRAGINSFQIRSVQLLLLTLLVSYLYAVARDMDIPRTRLFCWVLAAGVGFELVLGYLNLFHIYPWMAWVLPDQTGRAMGLLTHPNYWGSIMALTLPIMWALLGPLAAVAILIPIVVSHSAGPVLSAFAGIIVAIWPDLGRKTRYFVIGLATGAASWVMTVHEWRLSGRREVWQAIWPELIRYPLIGQGFGDWRVWADQYNAKLSAVSGKVEAFATLQAHNEPYQLLFELGLIGLVLGLGIALQAGVSARIVWQKNNEMVRRNWWKRPLSMDMAWLSVGVVAVVNSFGSPTFHLPAQAAIAAFSLARLQYSAAAWLALDKSASGMLSLDKSRARGAREKAQQHKAAGKALHA